MNVDATVVHLNTNADANSNVTVKITANMNALTIVSNVNIAREAKVQRVARLRARFRGRAVVNAWHY